MPAPDKKERNFCFMYKGETLCADTIEKLHGNSAECVYCEEDGNWYARVSLLRNFGRRAANVPNIIDEYNKLVANGCKINIQSSITCFNTNKSSNKDNQILRKIQIGQRTNQTYWTWSLKKPKRSQAGKGQIKSSPGTVKKKVQSTAPAASILTGLEGLVRELTLNPAKLDMHGAYVAISRNYLLCRNKELSLTGQMDSEDRDFLIGQLSRFFSNEMAYASRPFKAHRGHNPTNRTQGTMEALAASNGGSADDYEFIKSNTTGDIDPMHVTMEPNPFISAEPNDSICTCFRRLLALWAKKHATDDDMELTTNEIVCMLNGGGMMSGAYRSTCVPGFIRPFMQEKLIKVKDHATKPPNYIIDVKGMAAKLGIVIS